MESRGIEPRTSRMLSERYTTKPRPHPGRWVSNYVIASLEQKKTALAALALFDVCALTLLQG